MKPPAAIISRKSLCDQTASWRARKVRTLLDPAPRPIRLAFQLEIVPCQTGDQYFKRPDPAVKRSEILLDKSAAHTAATTPITTSETAATAFRRKSPTSRKVPMITAVAA